MVRLTGVPAHELQRLPRAGSDPHGERGPGDRLRRSRDVTQARPPSCSRRIVSPPSGRLAARRPAVQGIMALPRHRLRDVLGRDWILGYLLLLPAIAVLVGLIAYPFLYAIYLSLQNKPIGAPGTFV